MIFIFFRKDNNSVLSHIKYNGDANDNLDIYIYIYIQRLKNQSTINLTGCWIDTV